MVYFAYDVQVVRLLTAYFQPLHTLTTGPLHSLEHYRSPLYVLATQHAFTSTFTRPTGDVYTS
jgi:hypothetical protein